MRFRLIPSLVIKDGRLIKTIKHKEKIYLGDPINAVQIFNKKEVDELQIIDLSVHKDYEYIKKICNEAFMPIIYGGNIKSLDDAKSLLNNGVEKIILNTSIHKYPDLVKKITNIYGKQSIIASVDYKKNYFGKRHIVYGRKKSKSKLSIEEYCEYLVNLGVGEICLTNVDRDGTMEGLDVNIVDPKKYSLPVLISCGFFDLNQLKEIKFKGYSGLVGSSRFVFQNTNRGILINYPKYENFI